MFKWRIKITKASISKPSFTKAFQQTKRKHKRRRVRGQHDDIIGNKSSDTKLGRLPTFSGKDIQPTPISAKVKNTRRVDKNIESVKRNKYRLTIDKQQVTKLIWIVKLTESDNKGEYFESGGTYFQAIVWTLERLWHIHYICQVDLGTY